MAEVVSYASARPATPVGGVLAPDTASATGLEIRLFGTMEVRVCGHPLPRLRSRKGLWLLALLALRAGQDVERDWLAGTLWPDNRDADARRSLRQSLHDLRLALGPEAGRLGCESPRTLRLDLSSDAWLDVLAFDTFTTAAAPPGRRPGKAPEALEAAVHLYRGPLLEDCSEEWVMGERGRREQQYLKALETLASTASACREYAAAAGYLRLAVGVDPLREDLQRALMEALAAEGNGAAALQVFRQFRARLWREMATEPDAETTSLYRRLREAARETAAAPVSTAPAVASQPVPASPALPSLPQPRTALIGRESETEEVVVCLGRARLVTLTGTGGVGKTRLALRVAESQADEFAGGAWFVDLAPVTDTAGVAEAVRKALGIQPVPAQPLVEVLCQHLATSRLLLVLDNCEQVLDACATLADALLSACPHLRILATSRQALGLRGETVWRVPSLAMPPLSAAAEEYEDYAAVRLFVARAREAASAFQVTPHNAPALLRVCTRLDGIPLAIELAAARVRVLTVEEIDARLRDQFRLLTGGDRAAMPRQQTLRGALDWSWDLLAEPERALLSRLSVFAGGGTLEAAEVVCAGEGVDELDVLDLMTALVDKSLLLAEGQADGTTRYRLLETVRQYGRERLSEYGTEQMQAVCSRHQAFFVALSEAAATDWGTNPTLWAERLDTELDNLRVALEWQGTSPTVRQESARRALQLAGRLAPFWLLKGYLREGRERLRAALSFASAEQVGEEEDAAQKVTRARALRGLASLTREIGDYSETQALYDEIVALYRELDDRRNVASALSEMGVLAQYQSDFPRAQCLLEEGLAMYRELEDPRCIAISLTALGILAGEQGDLSRGRPLLEEALAIHREMGNKRGIATTLTNLGINVREQGDYATARALLEEALSLHREMGNQRSIGAALINLGGTVGDMGDYAAAQSLLEEALALHRETGNRRATATTLTALGIIVRPQGDLVCARALLTESLALHRELGDRHHVAVALQSLAAVDVAQGRPEQALRLLGAVEALHEAIGASLTPGERLDLEEQIASARAVLSSESSDSAWAVGRAMDFDEVCRVAAIG